MAPGPAAASVARRARTRRGTTARVSGATIALARATAVMAVTVVMAAVAGMPISARPAGGQKAGIQKAAVQKAAVQKVRTLGTRTAHRRAPGADRAGLAGHGLTARRRRKAIPGRTCSPGGRGMHRRGGRSADLRRPTTGLATVPLAVAAGSARRLMTCGAGSASGVLALAGTKPELPGPRPTKPGVAGPVAALRAGRAAALRPGQAACGPAPATTGTTATTDRAAAAVAPRCMITRTNTGPMTTVRAAMAGRGLPTGPAFATVVTAAAAMATVATATVAVAAAVVVAVAAPDGTAARAAAASALRTGCSTATGGAAGR
jgi:hypothetical protein